MNALLASAAIFSAYTARQSTKRLIEEERRPFLDIVLIPPTSWKKEDTFAFWPVYLVNLGRGVATDIVADSSGRFMDRPSEPSKKSFMLPFHVTHDDREFSFATAKSPNSKEQYKPSRVNVEYSDITRGKHWQYTAEIVLNKYGMLTVTDQETKLLGARSSKVQPERS